VVPDLRQDGIRHVFKAIGKTTGNTAGSDHAKAYGLGGHGTFPLAGFCSAMITRDV
jgi:hypothetical protein